ncbi:hypothetical protein [Promicromonospora sp. NPDC090134]|uniref:hypothetical protein n=1 Tax=Promicromonospora sp. NPDC090134 TaxID=3364408 RepID=UPI00381E9EA5
MLAIAPGARPHKKAALPRDCERDEPVDLPLVSSGDPIFASRTDEILRSTIPGPDDSRPS